MTVNSLERSVKLGDHCKERQGHVQEKTVQFTFLVPGSHLVSDQSFDVWEKIDQGQGFGAPQSVLGARPGRLQTLFSS